MSVTAFAVRRTCVHLPSVPRNSLARGVSTSSTTTCRSPLETSRLTSMARISRTSMPSLSALARYYASKSFPEHTVIQMPALSPTMTSGNIGAWQKQPGDSISPGDVLVEIETDKAQMDFEFQEEGVIAKLLVESGEKDVAVGNPIAVYVEEGTDIGAFADFTIEDAGGAKEAPPPKEEASESSDPPKEKAPAKQQSSPTPKAQESESTGGRLETSLDRLFKGKVIAADAKQLALEKGVSIKDIKGTGKGGLITKSDVEKAKSSGGISAASSAVAPSGSTYSDIPLTSMRKTIASRLQASKVESPHYYVSSSLSVSKLLKTRVALNAASNGEYKLSVNDFIIKACALALLQVPIVNSSYMEKENIIRQYNVADISVAVATPVGLMTPIVKSAHAKGLKTISSEVKSLAARARDGKLKPDEYQGGTFTISNMGMNPAVERFTAVINPPQAGILAVGATNKVAVEDEEGGVAWDEQIVVTGSFDHRVVDGAVGADFMKALKKIVENPLDLLL